MELINTATKNMLRQIAKETAKGTTTYQMDVYSRAIKNLQSVMGIKPDAKTDEGFSFEFKGDTEDYSE